MDRKWTREEVEETLREILVDALGVGKEKIVPEASLVHDLGVESIDFLDIGFRVQQTFGVELPNRAIQDKVLNWRNLGNLGELLKEHYGVQVSPEEIKRFRTMGIREIIHWLSGNRGITAHPGEAEKIASELAERLVGEVRSLGFGSSVVDREGIAKQLLENLNSPKIVEAMLRLLSVGSLVDFIAARVGNDSQ